MSEKWVQHLGDDQLVGGMPKHMVGVAGGKSTEGGPQTYWRYKPKPQACGKCQAMKDVWFKEKPGPVHPNCKCEIEEFKGVKVNGRTDIVIPPGVDLAENIAEAKRKGRECEEQAEALLAGLPVRARTSNPLPLGRLVFWSKCQWIFDNFKSGARYDYKTKGAEYEAFGNYHYGVYTSAMGINATFAQVAAGAWQIWQRTSEWSREFADSWFDDPADNEAIRKGQKFPF
ncbi:polymorphic toxin type 44 domain-containing protein [Pseudodesulfovibrio pelocollis]|uniref:polymorphic toxin type 44 domain-containing protein n=1 Tax=Pseudodesulfovibrio pelocollis TaxID=3051432 RepID=UPI00255AF272|nr:polymorphic toxin type 44 domain-containing protein [Pseudodesulfovibrio sp. SB368]